MIVYLDSCVLIHFFDEPSPIRWMVTEKLADLAGQGHQIAVSDLVELECKIRPIRKELLPLVATIELFFNRADVAKFQLSTNVFRRATEIRARNNLKLADALHLATAIENGCDLFVTNDLRLEKFKGLAIEILTPGSP